MTKNLSTRLKPITQALREARRISSYDKESLYEIKTAEMVALADKPSSVHMTKNLSTRLKPITKGST